mmetsp:Transcript_3876/g.10980  ORF Transcript_3876/g.10980 Transcript_3876/m.10980 type:complete len:216 (-) Transcript_3876:25-672(-)
MVRSAATMTSSDRSVGLTININTDQQQGLSSSSFCSTSAIVAGDVREAYVLHAGPRAFPSINNNGMVRHLAAGSAVLSHVARAKLASKKRSNCRAHLVRRSSSGPNRFTPTLVDPSSGTTPTFWSTSNKRLCQVLVTMDAFNGTISVNEEAAKATTEAMRELAAVAKRMDTCINTCSLIMKELNKHLQYGQRRTMMLLCSLEANGQAWWHRQSHY